MTDKQIFLSLKILALVAGIIIGPFALIFWFHGIGDFYCELNPTNWACYGAPGSEAN